MKKHTSEENQEKKVTLLQKVSYLFDRKQKRQIAGLALLILIGGLLETVGVSMLLPVVQAIMDPEQLMENELVGKVTKALHIETSRQLIILMLGALIALYVVKNAYLLFQTYVQNTFVTRNRNRMISRVMREFLNRPYEEYLGADIPTVFRLTDSDIPNAFQLILVMIQMVTEIVVAGFLCIVLVVVSPVMSLFIFCIFLGMTLMITKVLKPRLNAIGHKNQQIQSRIAKWRIQSIYGLKDVKVLHREEFFVRNYYERRHRRGCGQKLRGVQQSAAAADRDDLYGVDASVYHAVHAAGRQYHCADPSAVGLCGGGNPGDAGDEQDQYVSVGDRLFPALSGLSV